VIRQATDRSSVPATAICVLKTSGYEQSSTELPLTTITTVTPSGQRKRLRDLMVHKSTKPNDAERRVIRHMVEASDTLRAIGITDPKQVVAPPGPEGALLRLAAWMAIPDCPCGGEHLVCDHDESDGPLEPHKRWL
jgi:hypothetical protein